MMANVPVKFLFEVSNNIGQYKTQTAHTVQNADWQKLFLCQKRVYIRFYNLPILSRNHLTIFAFLGNVFSFLSWNVHLNEVKKNSFNSYLTPF